MRSTSSDQRDHFAEVSCGDVMSGDGGGVAEIAADPVRAVDALRDDDELLVDDPNHAAGRELAMFRASWKRSSRVPTASTARNLPSASTTGRAIATTHSLLARASNDAADGMVVSGEDLLEVVAIAREEASGLG